MRLNYYVLNRLINVQTAYLLEYYFRQSDLKFKRICFWIDSYHLYFPFWLVGMAYIYKEDSNNGIGSFSISGI